MTFLTTRLIFSSFLVAVNIFAIMKSSFVAYCPAEVTSYLHSLPAVFGLLLRWLPRCFRSLSFIASFYCGHVRCRSSIDFAIWKTYSKGACSYSAHQCRKGLRIEWVTPSTYRTLKDFSSYTVLQLGISVHSFCVCSVEIIDARLRLRTSASSFSMLSFVTFRLRRNWPMAEYEFNEPSW